MRALFHVLCVVICISLQELCALDCPDLETARALYNDEKIDEAISILKCHIARNKDELDAQRLLSDIYWWEGNLEPSITLLRELEKATRDSKDKELRIHIQKRLAVFRLLIGFQAFWATNHSGFEPGFDLGYRYKGKNEARVSAHRLTKVFEGTGSLSDSVFALSHTTLHSKQWYTEFSFQFSPNSSFSPRWGLFIEPHWVSKSSLDFSVGSKFSHYSNQDVFLLMPSVRKPFGDKLTLGIRTDVAMSSDALLSALGLVEYRLSHDISVSVSGAFGKTYEGPQLTNNFRCLVIGGRYHVTPHLIARLNGEIYRSDLRTEDRIGGGLEWLF